MSRYQQLISAGIILTVVTGGVVGTASGLSLDGFVANQPVLAIIAAFLAVIAGTLVRHFTVFASIRGAGPGPGRLIIPGIVLLNAMIAAIGGGLAGYLISLSVLSPPPAAWIGCLSGVIASVAMELLMINYRARFQ